MPVAPQFEGDSRMRIGDADFFYGHPITTIPDGLLAVEKPRSLVEAYVELWAELQPRRVVELGINYGGSTAMLHQLGGLERIVSFELSETPVDALERFVADRGAQDVVRAFYGIDQGDRQRVAAIVDEELSGRPIDLVIDDASHLYRESRASFEVLFPRLRPGGLYLLEDWRWQHQMAALVAAALEDDEVRRTVERRMVAEDRAAPETAMSRLVLELVIARAGTEGVVEELTIGSDWAAVRRGPADLDPETFRLDEAAPDHLVLLAPVR